MKPKKTTVGKLATDLKQKTLEERSVVELERAMHKDYIDELLKTHAEAKKTMFGDFFITVLTKKERLLDNVLRNYFFARESCPTPDYDQSVYHYKKADDRIEFLWVIPSKDTCMLLLDYRPMIAPAEYELLTFVLKFADGTLGALAKKLNGEAVDSPLLVH
jgi:hypothetical protein